MITRSGSEDGMAARTWAIVLPPGGPGSIQPVVSDHLAGLVAPAHIVVMTSGRGRPAGPRWTWMATAGVTVRVPWDCGTAGCIALGLLAVFERAADAPLVILPGDRPFGDRALFREGIDAAVVHVRHQGGIVVGAVEPSGVRESVGVIVPIGPRVSGMQRVLALHDRPTAATALCRAGAIWNTGVVVATAQRLLALLRRHVPEMAATVVRALCTRATDRDTWLRSAFASLPRVDFTGDVLAATPALTAYVWPAAVGWPDNAAESQRAAGTRDSSPRAIRT